MKRLLPVISISLTAVLAAAACTGGGDDAGFAASTAAPATTMAPPAVAPGGESFDVGEPEAPSEGDEAGDGAGGTVTDANAVVTTVDPADFGRMIVFTATLEVEVDDVITAGEQAQAAVAGLGGFLFGQETQTGERPRSVLTIKVEPENFSEALRRLSGLGKLLSQTVFADDVTERVVDLQSQITTAEASVQRLRRFLEDATDLEDVAILEAELLRRETDLELLRGRLRTLENQVALATIVLALVEPTPPDPEPAIELLETAYARHDGGQACPGADRMTIDEGDDLTLCYVLTNTGTTPLTDIEVREPGLDADMDDMILVEGSLEAPLQPGERLILALEAVADPEWYLVPNVSARPLDPDGETLRLPITVQSDVVDLEVVEDTSLPGFTDALAAAGRALERIAGVIVVAAGWLVPFLWVPVLLGFFVWYRRRERSRRANVETHPEPPPEEPGDAQSPPS